MPQFYYSDPERLHEDVELASPLDGRDATADADLGADSDEEQRRRRKASDSITGGVSPVLSRKSSLNSGKRCVIVTRALSGGKSPRLSVEEEEPSVGYLESEDSVFSEMAPLVSRESGAPSRGESAVPTTNAKT